MADMQQETKDLQVCVRSLQEKVEVINQVTFCYVSSSLRRYRSKICNNITVLYAVSLSGLNA